MLKAAHYVSLLAVFVAPSSSAMSRHLQSPTQQLDALANRFVDQSLAHDPTVAYEAGLNTTIHDRFEDRTPTGIASFVREEREDLHALLRLDAATLPASAMPTYARLREKLESDLQLRVCKTELWNVNHFDGWQSAFADVADAQPVDNPDQRAQALRRWASLPAYIDVEIANLRRGLGEGYSAPKSVVRRVIQQMNSLAAGPPEQSPFFSPAARSNDPEFKAAFRQLIIERINPALKRYGEFLKEAYLPRARSSIAISDLPNGPACYRAFLRAETTLDRSPEQVYALGKRAVAINSATVLRLGRKFYGAADIPATLVHVKSAPAEHFRSKDELLAFSRHFLERAKEKTAALLISRLPEQDIAVEPERAFEEAAGVSSHLDIQPDTSKPAIYRIELGNWSSETRGEAEIVVAHESLPGHHLQIALAREISPASRLSKLVSNAAYQEGWARYAEGMAEEAGIYDTPDAAILRRIWPARGMVVDPGLHALHWTREQAITYLMSTGRFTRKSADAEVDRIAVMPGQLTAYDSGALVIMSLRNRAEQQLGKRFNLKSFNRALLEEGVVPLNELRRHVTAWIESQARSGRTN